MKHIFTLLLTLSFLSSAVFAEKVLLDFEKNRDINLWETEEGDKPEKTAEKVLGGAACMKVYMDSKISTSLLDRDWTGHSHLLIDVENPFTTPVSVSFMLADLDWLDRKSYWNQHNQFILIEPGRSVVSIPLENLYRGEEDRRNIDIKSNIDLSAVVKVELEFKGQEGAVYLDNMRLGGEAIAALQQPGPAVAPVKKQAPVKVPAPVPVQAAKGDKLLIGFENVRDMFLWEKRNGWFDPEQVKQHATEGEHSLKVGSSSLLVNYNFPSSWLGYKALEFDVYNDGKKPVAIEILIGDKAWTQSQNYYNRHNQTFRILPGANPVRIDLLNLYRGEANRRNTHIPRNIDLDSIVQVNLKTGGKTEFLYFDNFRLSGGAGAAQAGPAAAQRTAAPPAPPVATATPVSTPAPVVKHGSGVKKISSFETVRELFLFEKREGWFDPEQSTEHVTDGASSLKIAAATLLASYDFPSDWTGYADLVFNVYSEAAKPLALEIMIGDAAWNRDQTYYNRYNKVVRLLPGENEVRIALGDLYRGESNKRNTKIPRNIDLDSIKQINIKVLGKEGFIYLDNIRLEGGPDEVTVAEPVSKVEKVEVAAQTPKEASPAVAQKKKIATDKIWNSFESLKDTAAWEVRYGEAPDESTEHVTEGGKSFRVYPGNLLATYKVPGDWDGYSSFEFDVYNAGAAVTKIEVMIGDEAWGKKQTYWNRFNASYMAIPGENKISIPIDGLYRGEAGSRNRDIDRNIDPDSITQVNLWFREGDGPLYLDNCKLKGFEDGEVSIGLAGSGSGRKAQQKTIFSFEDSLRDFASWTLFKGTELEVQEIPGTENKALKIDQNSIVQTFQLPADWTGFETFSFKAFSASEGLMKMEIMIGDEPWTKKQTYWNRYNSVVPIIPGENELEIPVEGMYRGEPASRNRDLEGNLDPSKIVQLTVRFISGEGEVYLDDFELKSEGENSASVWAFDFGPENQAVWPGFMPVTWNTGYTQEKGYGLERSQLKANYATDVTFPSRLFQDALWFEQGDFRVDVPNGQYQVHVFFEEAGYWAGEHTKHTYRSIHAEGAEKLLEDRSDVGGNHQAHYYFENVEPLPGGEALKPYYDKLYAPKNFTVDVQDGQLNIQPWADARNAARVSAIVVSPVGDEVAEKWFGQLLAQNYKEAKSKAAYIKDKPGVAGEVLLGELKSKPFVVFETKLARNYPLNFVPTDESLNPGTALTLAGKELGTISFGIHAGENITGLKINTDELEENGIEIDGPYVVRHLPKRGYNDLSFRLTPWYLQPFETIDIPAGVSRQIIFNLSAKEAVKGPAQLKISSEQGEQLMGCNVKLLNIELPEVQKPISFFNMPKESLALFRKYGATAVSGGGLVGFKGFKDGKAELDFNQVDVFLNEARELGYAGHMFDYGGPGSIAGINLRNAEASFARIGKPAGLDSVEAAKKVFAALKEYMENKDLPHWSVNIADEPRFEAETAKLISSASFLREVAPWLNTVGYYGFDYPDDKFARDDLFRVLRTTVTKGYTPEMMAEAHELENHIALYSLGRNRYVFGPLLWKHFNQGVSGYIQWHAWIQHGYQFFDLDGREPDMGLVALRSDGVCPTLDLVRIKEGINDLRYLTLLEQVKGEDAVHALLADIDTSKRSNVSGIDLDALREKVTGLIEN